MADTDAIQRMVDIIIRLTPNEVCRYNDCLYTVELCLIDNRQDKPPNRPVDIDSFVVPMSKRAEKLLDVLLLRKLRCAHAVLLKPAESAHLRAADLAEGAVGNTR